MLLHMISCKHATGPKYNSCPLHYLLQGNFYELAIRNVPVAIFCFDSLTQIPL